MKRCSTCKLEKAKSEFSLNRSTDDGYQYECKICKRKSNKKSYEKNYDKWRGNVERKAIRKKYDALRIAQDKMFILEYLKSHPCVVCGESDVVVLEFDHIDPKEKKSSVARLVQQGSSMTMVRHEISKCQVLCYNCHRRKTSKDCNSYRLVPEYGNKT